MKKLFIILSTTFLLTINTPTVFASSNNNTTVELNDCSEPVELNDNNGPYFNFLSGPASPYLANVDSANVACPQYPGAPSVMIGVRFKKNGNRLSPVPTCCHLSINHS